MAANDAQEGRGAICRTAGGAASSSQVAEERFDIAWCRGRQWQLARRFRRWKDRSRLGAASASRRLASWDCQGGQLGGGVVAGLLEPIQSISGDRGGLAQLND